MVRGNILSCDLIAGVYVFLWFGCYCDRHSIIDVYMVDLHCDIIAGCYIGVEVLEADLGLSFLYSLFTNLYDLHMYS